MALWRGGQAWDYPDKWRCVNGAVGMAREKRCGRNGAVETVKTVWWKCCLENIAGKMAQGKKPGNQYENCPWLVKGTH